MLKLFNIVYYSHSNCKAPVEVLKIHAPSTGFADHIKHSLHIRFLKHLNYEGIEKINGIEYIFFKRKNSFWKIPYKTHNYIKQHLPDIMIVEGLIFPLQVIALKIVVGNKCKIICQHHGEAPFRGIKKILQKLADRFIDCYMFTSCGNATAWIEQKIINTQSKCFEVLEASSDFVLQDKTACKQKLGLRGNFNFLWVGRLNANKDPMTVLYAFLKYIRINPEAKLYVIYQSDELLEDIIALLNENRSLKNAVVLIGRVNHNTLPEWFSAANFFVSGSHKEGSGYSLLEAMACGCIPVITDIPSFRKITLDGKFGFLYPPGNVNQLIGILENLDKISQVQFSDEVIFHFKTNLSFQKIADETYELCCRLTGK